MVTLSGMLIYIQLNSANKKKSIREKPSKIETRTQQRNKTEYRKKTELIAFMGQNSKRKIAKK